MYKFKAKKNLSSKKQIGDQYLTIISLLPFFLEQLVEEGAVLQEDYELSCLIFQFISLLRKTSFTFNDIEMGNSLIYDIKSKWVQQFPENNDVNYSYKRVNFETSISMKQGN